MSDTGADFFDRLEVELRAATGRRGTPVTQLPRMAQRVALAVAVLIALAIAVVPALIVLGSDEGEGESPSKGLTPDDPPPRSFGGTVVAAGRAGEAGPWRLEVYRSDRLADPDSGEVYQPAGLPCLGISLLDPPKDTQIGLSGACGRFRKTPGFSRLQITIPNRAGAKVREILVYGRAPERAAGIVITPAGGGSPIQVRLREGPASVRGDFYLHAVEGNQVEGGRVNWIDRSGRPGSRGIALLPP